MAGLTVVEGINPVRAEPSEPDDPTPKRDCKDPGSPVCVEGLFVTETKANNANEFFYGYRNQNALLEPTKLHLDDDVFSFGYKFEVKADWVNFQPVSYSLLQNDKVIKTSEEPIFHVKASDFESTKLYPVTLRLSSTDGNFYYDTFLETEGVCVPSKYNFCVDLVILHPKGVEVPEVYLDPTGEIEKSFDFWRKNTPLQFQWNQRVIGELPYDREHYETHKYAPNAGVMQDMVYWANELVDIDYYAVPDGRMLLTVAYLGPASKGCDGSSLKVKNPDKTGVDTCNFGESRSIALVLYDLDESTVSHEMGHVLGFGHANALICNDFNSLDIPFNRPFAYRGLGDSKQKELPEQGRCEVKEYLDMHDLMGYGLESVSGPQFIEHKDYQGYKKVKQVTVGTGNESDTLWLINPDSSSNPRGNTAYYDVVSALDQVSGESYYFEVRSTGVRVLKLLSSEYRKTNASIDNDQGFTQTVVLPSTGKPLITDDMFEWGQKPSEQWAYKVGQTFTSWDGVVSMTVQSLENCPSDTNPCTASITVSIRTQKQIDQETIKKLADVLGWDIPKACENFSELRDPFGKKLPEGLYEIACVADPASANMPQFGQAGIANASGGRTVISLTDDYVQSLAPGDYQFTAEWTDGDYAVLNLHVPEATMPPETVEPEIPETVIPALDFGVWARHGSAVAEIPAPFAQFSYLMFDGEKVPVTVLPATGAPGDTGTYGVTATALPDGTTQLALHHDYLKALPRETEHVFTAVFDGGWPAVTLTLTPAAGFRDVDHTSIFHEHMHWMLDSGLSTGWPMGDGVREYRPGNVLTRESMAAFLFRISGETDRFVAPTDPTFADVAQDTSNFYREIEWMAARKISTGWEIKDADGNVVRREFRPGQPLTRESAAAFLYRLAGADHTFTGTMFADITGADAKRRDIETAVEWMAAKGISTGTPSQTGGLPTFNPGGGLKRDSMAAFIYRAVNEAKVITLPG